MTTATATSTEPQWTPTAPGLLDRGFEIADPDVDGNPPRRVRRVEMWQRLDLGPDPADPSGAGRLPHVDQPMRQWRPRRDTWHDGHSRREIVARHWLVRVYLEPLPGTDPTGEEYRAVPRDGKILARQTSPPPHPPLRGGLPYSATGMEAHQAVIDDQEPTDAP